MVYAAHCLSTACALVRLHRRCVAALLQTGKRHASAGCRSRRAHRRVRQGGEPGQQGYLGKEGNPQHWRC